MHRTSVEQAKKRWQQWNEVQDYNFTPARLRAAQPGDAALLPALQPCADALGHLVAQWQQEGLALHRIGLDESTWVADGWCQPRWKAERCPSTPRGGEG